MKKLKKLLFSIGGKITGGFAIILILTGVVFLITSGTLEKSREINTRINQVYNPSIEALEKLKSTILRTRMLITNWAFVQSREDTDEKLSLIRIIEEELPKIKSRIDTLSVHWSEDHVDLKQRIYKDLEELIMMYEQVRTYLPDMRSYDDPMARFMIRDYAEEGGEIDIKATLVINELNSLIRSQRFEAESDSVSMIRSFDTLDLYIRNVGIMLVLGGVIIAFFTVRSIVRPVQKLKGVLLSLSEGVFPRDIKVKSNDEVGQMALAMNQMVSGMKRTTAFAHEIGKGNFDASYQPLSKDDELGKALLIMRDELRENERILEQKVEERTREIQEKKEKIEEQNRKVSKLYDDIRDSIKYAKRLQESIMPNLKRVNQIFPQSFIFYKPKDIVSGDFYFVRQVEGKIIFSVVDCTGHGVPGAFMSLVGYNSLNRVIEYSNRYEPGEILEELNSVASSSLNKTVTDPGIRDGMDMALCVLDLESMQLKYAGAYNSLYFIRDGELSEIKGDKIPIGSVEHNGKSYQTHNIDLKKGDTIYLTSDGFVDQFGGPKGKKFLPKRFRKMLTDINELGLDRQNEEIQKTLEKWRGDHEQVDDILVMGVRV